MNMDHVVKTPLGTLTIEANNNLYGTFQTRQGSFKARIIVDNKREGRLVFTVAGKIRSFPIPLS